MIKDKTENPRHLPMVYMRGIWFSRRVHPEGLEPSTNGLRDHCYDALNPDSIEPKRTPVWVCPLILCPLSQISVFFVLFTNDGESFSNRLKLNFAYISVVTTD